MADRQGRSLWIINHHATGPGRHEYIARELGSRGWRVKLFASSFVHNIFREQKVYQSGQNHLAEILRGVDRVWIKTPPYRGNGSSRFFNHLVFSCRAALAGLGLAPPGIVIGSSAHPMAALAALCLAKKHQVPFIFEVRDIWPQTLVDIGAMHRYSPAALGMGILEKFLYRKACVIISALPGGKEHVARLGIDRHKVIYIPNGTDLAWYDRCAEENVLTPELTEFFQGMKERLVFIYAGAHGYANGLETLVEAAEILHRAGAHRIQILLVGDGPGKEGLVRAARERALPNVTFLGPQDKNLVPVILKRSDACLFHLRNSRAYRYGISSNKLFEYMASARPLITAVDAPRCPQLARFALQVPSDDPESLAGAMLHLAAMPAGERVSLGLRARSYVERFHDVPVLIDRLEEALERCLLKALQCK